MAMRTFLILSSPMKPAGGTPSSFLSKKEVHSGFLTIVYRLATVSGAEVEVLTAQVFSTSSPSGENALIIRR
jgi:hypothetical protein